MGLISRLMWGNSAQPNGERRNINSPDVVRAIVLGGGGGHVSPGNAEQLSAVLACVRVLSESVAMLPLVLYERHGDKRKPAIDHPLYSLLHDLPNPEISSFDMRAMMMRYVVLYGNAYAQKVVDGGGRVRELWPLRTDRMESVYRSTVTGELIYKYRNASGGYRTFPSDEIMHVRGLTSDGIIGLSVIESARRAFTTPVSMEVYQEAFYENGGQPGGLLKHPGSLGDEAYKRLIASWEDRHMGTGNSNKVAVLEEGLDYMPLGVPQSDQQFLEQKKYSKGDIASMFRVPSHMVNDLEKASFSNIEEMAQEFVDYTLTPWFVQWEQAISRDLLTPVERKKYYPKHTAQALLRGNNTSRSQFYASGLQWGYFTINDVRNLEDLNPTANGDTHFVPLNMVPLDRAVMGVGVNQPAASKETPAAGQQRSQGAACTCGQCKKERSELRTEDDPIETLRVSRVEMARSMQPVFEDVAARMVRREARDVRRAVEKFLNKRSREEFITWLDEFYRGDDFTPALRDAFRPVLLSYARQAMFAASAELGRKSPGLVDDLRTFVDEYVESLANEWASGSRQQLESLLELPEAQTSPETVIDERIAEWEQTKPEKIAMQHAFQALNALVIASYGYYLITRWVWAASGQSCPFCRSLDGQFAGFEKYFIEAGSQIDGGMAGMMLVQRSIRHGPLHRGCDCVVIAA